MAQDGNVQISQQDAEVALEALAAYLSDNETGAADNSEKLLPYRRAMLSLGIAAGGWRPVTEKIQLGKSNIVELKSGNSTLLAVQVLLPEAEHSRLAYLSMCESGIDWVHSEDIDGWRAYEPKD